MSNTRRNAMVMSFEKPKSTVLPFKQVNFLKKGNYTYSSARDIVRLKGVITNRSSRTIEDKILDGIARKKINLIIDLTNVTSVEGDGVRVLNTALRMSLSFGRTLTLFGLRPAIKESLILADIYSKFTICETEDQAILEVA
jgi:anti-anti-sigma factor